MIVRQEDPAAEIAALEDEVAEVIRDMTERFRTLLDAAYTARVEGEPVTDKWPDLDVALRNFACPSALEVAESIAAYTDREQEELLAALAPPESDLAYSDGSSERLVWSAPRITTVAAVEGYHAGAESEALVYVTSDREWRITMLPVGDRPRCVHGTSHLVRYAVAHVLGMSPADPPVAAIEHEVLEAARALAAQ